MKGSEARKKSAIIILNGISLKKKLLYHEYLPALSSIFDVEVHETVSRNDAHLLASRFTEKNVDVILSAGGDGTLNQVVNGVLTGRETSEKLPSIGIVPIGSGNDFIRGAGMKVNVDHTLKVFTAFKTRPVDVGLVEYAPAPDSEERRLRYFVNVADIGMGPEVVGKVLSSDRSFGSEMAYYKSILNTFITYKPMVVSATTPEWSWKGKLRTLAVANGRYYGHGLCIAPEAVVDDRMFSIFICGNVSVLDFILHTGSLKKGKNVVMDEVLYKTANSIAFTSDSPCPIEADGELLGWLPAKVSMIERQLQFLI